MNYRKSDRFGEFGMAIALMMGDWGVRSLFCGRAIAFFTEVRSLFVGRMCDRFGDLGKAIAFYLQDADPIF